MLSLIPLVVGSALLALESVYSHELASLDKGLAEWAVEYGRDLNKGFLRQLNQNYELIFIQLIAYSLYMIALFALGLKLRTPRQSTLYAFPVMGIVLVVFISNQAVDGLKQTFYRPRPKYTQDYSWDPKVEPRCLQPFQPVFRIYVPKQDTCGLHLHSCPSGHTETITNATILAIYFTLYIVYVTNQALDDAQSGLRLSCHLTRSLVVFNYLLVILSILLASIFIPSVMIACIVDDAHYITDVVGGFLISLSCSTVFLWLWPCY